MDWGSIIVSGAGGLIGALAGVLAGLILGPVLSVMGDSIKGAFKALFVLGGIIAGIVFLPGYLQPHLEPVIARYVDPSVVPDEEALIVIQEDAEEVIPDEVIAEAIENALADLGDPFFEAVLAREPSRAKSVKTRLVAAFKQGGRERLVSELQQADQEIIKTAFPYYMARAQEDDLISAVTDISKMIRRLGVSDPETCHLWLYGGMIGKSFDYDRYIAAVGEEGHLALQRKLATAVTGADEILPEYDEDNAFRILSDIQDTLTQELGPEKIGLITAGQMPVDDEDARIACDASARFYDLVLAEDTAADILRYRYTVSPF